jgi:hypothetical protein
VSIYFPYNLPLKYSECVHFFHGCPGFWPVSQSGSYFLVFYIVLI